MCSLVGLRGGRRAWRTNFNTSLSWVLIEEKELNNVQNLIISDVNESTQPPTTSTKDTSSQHFPRFILVESKEENKPVTSLSPFVIQKVIQSIAGEPENIKKLHRSNQLLIEVSRKAHAENLLRAQTFHDLKVRVYPHTSLNSSKGVIRCPELGNCSEEEILEGTRSQGVTAIKRFKVKRNGELKNTNTFVFTFNTSVLPKTIKVAYFRVNVEVYIPNPLRCHHCQKYGHHEDRCSKDPICSKCGQVAEHPESQCRNELPLGIKLSALPRPWGLNSHWERC